MAQQSYREAAEEFEAIVALDRANGAAWKGLGMSLIQLREFERAIEACREAANIQAGSPECHYAYGFALGAVERYEESIRELDATLALQPNHLAAKQALVYSLTKQGQRTLESNPAYGESMLERAHKLDHANPAALSPLLEWYRATNQRGKAAKLLGSLGADLKAHPQIAPILEAMHADPAFHNVLHQAEAAAQSTGIATAQPPAKGSSITMLPCPNCKLPIADYAAICPHCSFQNRAVGRFATVDSGPDVIWQDVAYNIVCVLWLVSSAYDIWASLSMSEVVRDWFLTLGIANAGMGLGLIFKVEWVMFVAKIMLWLKLAGGGLSIIWALGLAHYGDFALAVGQFGLTCFFIYLINYHSD